ncbi:hypothetical protein K8M07_03965, partial [Schnuerera sp. xch1]|uniref:hypothetical protein n=1 Tax=Schnuerera sp. xch1 TaxID=2874283 RepID=UPI001CC020AD
ILLVRFNFITLDYKSRKHLMFFSDLEYQHIIFMTNGTSIPIDEIIRIEGEIFDVMMFHSCDRLGIE